MTFTKLEAIVNAEELIAGLRLPSAFPYPVEEVQVEQTHISVVFLAGPFVYKVKKSVKLGFLDFSTLALREHFCQEEVRLNRRLVPDVYVGVVPITNNGSSLHFEGEGTVVEWAVKMHRLPQSASLASRLERKQIDHQVIAELVTKLKDFYSHADRPEHLVELGGSATVRRNITENFDQTRLHIGKTVSPQIFEMVERRSFAELDRLASEIDARSRSGLPCDGHGDLRLDHVYYFPERENSQRFVIIDCIEFNERFRFSDPIADIAFLVMDLVFEGHPELASDLQREFCGDDSGLSDLLNFYAAYRAIVRAKVQGMQLVESEIGEKEKEQALAKSRAYWMLAASLLSSPNDRPCLILIAGLPGTGKTTLARQLAERANLEIIRSDVVRKESASTPVDKKEMYSPQEIDRTYRECLRRASARLQEGKRVVVDASFSKESHRTQFQSLARSLHVPSLLLECTAPDSIIRDRLEHRTGDASDADWDVYLQKRAAWEPVESSQINPVVQIDTSQNALQKALQGLRRWKIVD